MVEIIFVLSIYALLASGIVGGIYYLSQWYWQVQRAKAGKQTMQEMINVRLVAKKSMGTPARIYDWECEING